MEISDRELERIKEQAVMAAKVDEIENIVPEIFAAIKSLTKDIGAIPMEIVNCKQAMDNEIRKYIHDEFVTTDLFEKRMAEELLAIKLLISKAGWILSGMIGAASIFNYLIMHTNFFGV